MRENMLISGQNLHCLQKCYTAAASDKSHLWRDAICNLCNMRWEVGECYDLENLLGGRKRSHVKETVQKIIESENLKLQKCKKQICWDGSALTHSSYYCINGGKVDLINQLPACASPFLFMTEATSMLRGGNLNDIAWLYVAKDNWETILRSLPFDL